MRVRVVIRTASPPGRRARLIMVCVASVALLTLTACSSSRTAAPSPVTATRSTAVSIAETGTAGAATATATSPFVGAPKNPPAKGEALGMLSTFPAGTMGAFDSDSVGRRDRYRVEYEPFGGAPAEVPSLVARIVKATPVGAVERPLKLDGRALVAEIADSQAGDLTSRGGRFSATLGFVERSGLLHARLQDIRTVP